MPPEEVADFQALPGNGLDSTSEMDTELARWKHEIYQQPGDSSDEQCKKSGTDTGRTGKDAAVFCKGWCTASV